MSAVAVCRSSASLRLVEQPHILDRDHGLVGEGLQQRDLFVVKGFTSARRSTIAPMLSFSRNSGTLSTVPMCPARHSRPYGKFVAFGR